MYNKFSSITTVLIALFLTACKDTPNEVSSDQLLTVGPDVASYAISGSVTGLNGTLVLQNNGGDNLTVTQSADFIFLTELQEGESYTVSIFSNSSEQVCTIINKTGTVESVNSVQVDCVTPDPINISESGLNFNAVKNKLSMTYEHVLAIKPDGSLHVWGDNSKEQLGVAGINSSDTADRLVPTLNTLQDVRYVSAGEFNSLAITGDNGQVWSWGSNGSNQLGNTAYSLNNIGWPIQVKTDGMNTNLQGALAVASGLSYSVALMQNGTVFTWGYNQEGQLGLGHDDSTDMTDPVTAVITPVNNAIPNEVTTLINITAISAGQSHTLALDNNGIVWAWGDNFYGQVGNTLSGNNAEQHEPIAVTGLMNVVAITTGLNHSLALRVDGTVWAWGHNSTGQLGNGTNINSSVPVQVIGMTDVAVISAGSNASFAIKDDGTLWKLGNTSYENTRVPNITDDIISIAVGNLAHIAMKSNGELISWGGLNASGQLGNNSTKSVWNFEGVTGFGPVNVLNGTEQGVFDMLN